MNKFAVFVIGPAGTGKTTFCNTMIDYLAGENRKVNLVNLDPGKEIPDNPSTIDFKADIDIMDNWALNKIMKNFKLGPNGGLLKCLEECSKTDEWWDSYLNGDHDDFLFVDCPGQIEAYLHSDCMQKIMDIFKKHDFTLCSIFLLDSQFMSNSSKFLAGILNSLSAMLQLETSHINVVTKMDSLGEIDYDKYEHFFNPDLSMLSGDFSDFYSDNDNVKTSQKMKLDNCIKTLVENFGLVEFCPLDITEENSVRTIMQYIDRTLGNDDVDVDCRDKGFPGEKDYDSD